MSSFLHRKNILLWLFSSTFFFVPKAQEFSYRHYDIKEGLAGSSVYHMQQDQEGYIWFATETGLSRFDGTRFRNFTTRDGLTDNTILRMQADHKGRLWLSPFKNSICYYQNGRIYTPRNDTMLAGLELQDMSTVTETPDKRLLICDGMRVYELDSNNHMRRAWTHPINNISKIAAADSGQFYMMLAFTIYKSDTRKLTLVKEIEQVSGGGEQMIINDQTICWRETPSHLRILSRKYGLDYRFKVPFINTMRQLNDSIICLNTTDGTLFLNIERKQIERRFLPHTNVSDFLIDNEGGYWFATLNNGVYRLNSDLFRNLSISVNDGRTLGVHNLLKTDKHLLAASDLGYLQTIDGNRISLTRLDQSSEQRGNTYVSSLAKRGNLIVAGCSNGFYFWEGNGRTSTLLGFNSAKEINFKNDSELLVAGSNALYTIDLRQINPRRFLWMGRTTSLLHREDSTYFGTLNGLYLMRGEHRIFFFGDTSTLLHQRISSIRAGNDGTIWVATSGDGVVGMLHNRINYHFNTENGLSSNIARCVATDGNTIWVGTDKGLDRIDLSAAPASITQYSTSDGLGSDMINAILIAGDTIYIGTPEGVSYFNKKNILSPSQCRLKMEGVELNDEPAALQKTFALDYGKNSIRFNYVAISYKSAGDIDYVYRLHGLDTSWKTTTQPFLEFISLPPGDYRLELYAVNKFGVKSETYTAGIKILAPYWQRSWFILACMLACIAITWLILASRNRATRRKEATRRSFEQRLIDLEQKALLAQMNPHFIFNCLNSIQEFILDKDVLSANKYLTRFASLIRQTLDNSFQPTIIVADELKYLNTYLNLEQMRFKRAFTYRIEMDENLDPGRISIPAMILQPHIENAIRHGIQNKPGPGRYVLIRFFRQNDMVVCSILDNGIGRKEAQALKSAQHIEYQSRGMQLTQERIELINKKLEGKITVDITDHVHDDGQGAGTEVIICFPLHYKEKTVKTI